MNFNKLTNPFFLLLILITFLTSCATHQGYMGSNAVIVNKEFRVLGIAKGQAHSTRVLGIGGLHSDALVYDAKNDLYSSIELKPGQALTNITVDFKRSYYLVFSRTKVTVTAEIVDFNPSSDPHENIYGFVEKNGFKVGDFAVVEIGKKFEKKKIKRLLMDCLLLEGNPGETLPCIEYSEAYKSEGSFVFQGKRYSVGDAIEIKKETTSKKSVGGSPKSFENVINYKGKIVGIQNQKALLQEDGTGKYKLIEVEKSAK